MGVELISVRRPMDRAGRGPVVPAAEPAAPGSHILMVHGLTWNFYRGPSRWLPPLLASAGYPCLSLNMRDHDLQEPKEFELAHHDLRAGIDFLVHPGRPGWSCWRTATRATRWCAIRPCRATPAFAGAS